MTKAVGRGRALQIQIDALKRRRQQLAFDANMLRMLKVSTPHTERAAAEFDELGAVIADLEIELQATRAKHARLFSRNAGRPAGAGREVQPAQLGLDL